MTDEWICNPLESEAEDIKLILADHSPITSASIKESKTQKKCIHFVEQIYTI